MDESYREFVEKVASGGSPSQAILNRNVEHASIVIETIFRKAEDRVEILTSELNPSVYGTPSVVSRAIDFLRKPATEVRVLAEKDIDQQSHPLFAALRMCGLANRISVVRVPDEVQRRYDFHFMVADRRSFRFEESRDKFDAVVQFGNADAGSQLHAAFSAIEAQSRMSHA